MHIYAYDGGLSQILITYISSLGYILGLFYHRILSHTAIVTLTKNVRGNKDIL